MKINIKSALPRLLFAGVMICTALSCKKQDANYAQFIKDGPIAYPGKVDSVFSYAGNGRIKLIWKVPFDANITQYKIFWNFGSDSLLVPGYKPTGNDSVRTTLDNLPEGSYSFSVYTYDQMGRRSVPATKIARSYGAVFMSTVYNRQIRTSVKDSKTSTVTITWVNLDLNCIGTEWVYTKPGGSAGTYFAPIGISSTITNCDVTKPITYRSVFIPEFNAIDRYYSAYSTL
ncbi:MAG: hypothetical protein JWM28_3303 [Chitinophagaceae bacterium]|nr:hypothetical protein [Chitinophagaceae bacterium]